MKMGTKAVALCHNTNPSTTNQISLPALFSRLSETAARAGQQATGATAIAFEAMMM
jgi:hypothetical protein